MYISPLLTLSSLLAAGLAHAQGIGGSGPPPPTLSAPAPTGTWRPKASTDGLDPAALDGMGRTIYINSANDFCLLMPPDPTTQNLVDAEAVAVAYCTNPTNGTRPMPDGFIKSAHYRKTDKYVQITGTYDPAIMNLGQQDCGGEYDSEGAEGIGNPAGVTMKNGRYFFNFMGACDIPGSPIFCMRQCPDYEYCNNRYDLMGCLFVAPGDYDKPGFENCDGDSGLPVGVYNSSYTFEQGQPTTPTPVDAPASSNCAAVSSIAPSGVTYTWNQLAAAAATQSGSSASNSNGGGSSGGSTAKPSANSNNAAGSLHAGPAVVAALMIAIGAGVGSLFVIL